MAYVDPQVVDLNEQNSNDPTIAEANSLLSPDAAKQFVLQKISSGEAGSYNELYGGGTFPSYSDHPNIQMQTPSGETTTAAGKYQFIHGTWEDEKNRLGLKDFSPASQDTAAWDLANRTYQQQTGRSLLEDAQKKNVNWSALGGQWTSLAGGSKTQSEHTRPPIQDTVAPSTPDTNFDAPSSPLTSAQQSAAKKLMSLMWLQSSLNNVKLQKVDYDPYAVLPKG